MPVGDYYTDEQQAEAEALGLDLGTLDYDPYEGIDYGDIPTDVGGLVAGTTFGEKYGAIFGGDDSYKAWLATQYPDLDMGKVGQYFPDFPEEQYEDLFGALEAKKTRESKLIGEEYGAGIGELGRQLGVAGGEYLTTSKDVQRKMGLAQEGYLEGMKGAGEQYGLAGEQYKAAGTAYGLAGERYRRAGQMYGPQGLAMAELGLGEKRDIAASKRRFAEGRTQLRGTLLGQAGGLRALGGKTGFRTTGAQVGGETALYRRGAQALSGLAGGYAERQRSIEETGRIGRRKIGMQMGEAGTGFREAGLRYGEAGTRYKGEGERYRSRGEELRLGRKASIGALTTEGTRATQRYQDIAGGLGTKVTALGLQRGRQESLLQEAIESGIMGARGQARGFVTGLSGTALDLARLGAAEGQGWTQDINDPSTWVNPITGETGYLDPDTGVWVSTTGEV
jgi:hypothetical protein